MSLTRLVNGEEVELSPEEEAEVRAEWAANEEAARTAAAADVGQQNVDATAERLRADALAEIQRKMDAGAPQDQINRDLLRLLKEQL